MAQSFLDSISKRLIRQEENGLRRHLRRDEKGLIDFSSNDYLGLARSAELSQLITEEFKDRQLKNGSTGSRLLTGNDEYTEETEHFLAEFFQAESALLCNSGYAANLAVLSSIPQKDDVILYDELCHASLKDGARLSLAKRFSFRHNDLNDLEVKLKKNGGRKFIVVESIYSMDGDECPLAELAPLAKKFNACIILDEAHSTGVVGVNGTGSAIEQGVQLDVDIRIHTFGKAIGTHGACVVGAKLVKEYLINFSRPVIYTTAPSPHNVAAIRCSLQFLSTNPILLDTLKRNIESFVHCSESISNKTNSRSAIQSLLVPGNENVRKASLVLSSLGFDVRPIVSPTVPKGSERLRICLHAFNSESEIRSLCTYLYNIK